MSNLLIAYDRFAAEAFGSDHWSIANSYFGKKLLSAVLTIATIINDIDNGEYFKDAIRETAETLIDNHSDFNEVEGGPKFILTDEERESVIRFFEDAHRACRPYLPDLGTLTYHSHVTSEDGFTVYIVVKHFGEEHINPAVPGDSVRSSG